MNRLPVAFVAALLAAGPVAASDKTDVMTTVHGWVDAFNKADVKAAVATCADETSIIDDFPPHQWSGAGTCAKWAEAYAADAKKNDITDGAVTIGKPRHLDVAGEYAYLIVPATYTFKQKGKAVEQSGSLVTMTLQKVASGWRITAWAWADGVTRAAKAAP